MALGNKTLQDLIAPISAQLGHTEGVHAPAPPSWVHYPVRTTDSMTHEQIVNTFITEAQKINIRVSRCTQATLAQCVAAIVQEGVPEADALRSVICAKDERFVSVGLYNALGGLDCVSECAVWDASRGQENLSIAEAATYGVTYASAGIAETATVVQPSTPDCGRAISLLPLVHIAVVDAARIQATMLDIMREYDTLDGRLPSQLCFISGPSATADIELVRVEGVHGPMYVYYVVVD